MSDREGIRVFAPLSIESGREPLVWAVDEEHLINYLLPRDCPRVCFRSSADSSGEDIAHLLTGDRSARVIAIESAWLDRALGERIWIYALARSSFRLVDPIAGYHVSSLPVKPVESIAVESPLRTLIAQGVELRVMPSLWRLHDAVAASTLAFSMIRMRNARRR